MSPGDAHTPVPNKELRQIPKDELLKSVFLFPFRCSQEVCDTLTATARHSLDTDGILATRLCTHKEDVDHINQVQINKLKGNMSLITNCAALSFIVELRCIV